jgi:hypothetical protein
LLAAPGIRCSAFSESSARRGRASTSAWLRKVATSIASVASRKRLAATTISSSSERDAGRGRAGSTVIAAALVPGTIA